MARRFIGSFILLILAFTFISARLYLIMSDKGGIAKDAIAAQGQAKVKIYESRGVIYDKNLIPFVDNENAVYAVVDPLMIDGLSQLLDLVKHEWREKADKLVKEGRPFLIEVKAFFENVNGVECFRVSNRYSAPFIAAHTLGYTDSQGLGALGIEKSFDAFLNEGKREWSAVFPVDGVRRALSGLGFRLEGEYKKTNRGVVLTLHKGLQEIAEKAADLYMPQGAIVILDVETGEIAAMVSRPNFNPYDIGKSAENEGVFLNRAIIPYNVGSVFKIAVTAAYLENGGTDETFYCSGSIKVGANIISCQNKNGHKKIDLQNAFAQSCNVYFIELAKKIGAEKLLSTALTFGFDEENILAQALIAKRGNLPTLKNLSATAALANFSIGQGEFMATPLQIAQMVAVIAGDGSLRTPYLVKGTLDENKALTLIKEEIPPKYIVSSTTAQKIRELMVNTAINGTGIKANPDRGGAGVKTATAQTGILKDGKSIIQGWIAGFFPSAKPKYAVAVLAEDGISGGRSAGPVFKYIAENGYDLLMK